MTLARLLIAPLLSLLVALPAAAAPIPLPALSAYLNGIKTAEATFTQVNGDGSISTGKVFISRPGQMRFEYAPPDANLVLASAGTVAIFDAKSNQPPEQYPLNRTPLSLILARHIDLSRAHMVTGEREQDNKTIVTAQDPEHPDYGSLSLVFTDTPIQLRQWVVTDATGNQTTVILGPLKTGVRLPDSLFSIAQATSQRVEPKR